MQQRPSGSGKIGQTIRRGLVTNRVLTPPPPPFVPTYANFTTGATLRREFVAGTLATATGIRVIVQFRLDNPLDTGLINMDLFNCANGTSTAANTQVRIRRTATGVLMGMINGTPFPSVLTYTNAGGSGNPGGGADVITIILTYDNDANPQQSNGMTIYINGAFGNYVPCANSDAPVNLNLTTAITIGCSATTATTPAPFFGAMSQARAWLLNGDEAVALQGPWPYNSSPPTQDLVVTMPPASTVMTVAAVGTLATGQSFMLQDDTATSRSGYIVTGITPNGPNFDVAFTPGASGSFNYTAGLSKWGNNPLQVNLDTNSATQPLNSPLPVTVPGNIWFRNSQTALAGTQTYSSNQVLSKTATTITLLNSVASIVVSGSDFTQSLQPADPENTAAPTADPGNGTLDGRPPAVYFGGAQTGANWNAGTNQGTFGAFVGSGIT